MIKKLIFGALALAGLALVLHSMSESEKDAVMSDASLNAFVQFKVSYNKEYSSLEEAQYRMKIFQNNLNKIKTHNLDKNSSYKLGVNQFSDLTFEEFKSKYLISETENYQMSSCSASFDRLPSNSDPSNVDWNAAGKVHPPKDQQRCGSCWAFAAIGSVESAVAISGKPIPSLSEQELVDCSWFYKNLGCNGGLPASALAYIQDHKINSEQDYPYHGSNGICKLSKKGSVSISKCTRLAPGVENIKAALVSQPIAVAFHVQDDFMSYHSGVYNPSSCNSRPNHAVLAVGYNLEDNTPYFFIKNSWSESWGDKGFFKIAIGEKEGVCGLGSHDQNTFPTL